MPVRPKPAGYYFRDFDAALLHEIGACYPMGPPDAVCPILLDGATACLLEVRSETSRKAVLEYGDDRYFLKQVPWYCDTQNQIESSHAIQLGLTRAGLPVPRIVLTKAATTCATVNGGSFTIASHVAGRRFAGTPRQVENAARVLARLHGVSVHAPCAERESVFELIGAHIQLLAQVWQASNRPMSALSSFLREARDALDLVEARCVAFGFDAFQESANHGDFNPSNALFDDRDQVVAVVDFDNSDMGSRLHDVAEGLATFCLLRYRDETTNFSRDPLLSFDDARLQLFVASYESVSPLSEAERACLPWVVRGILIELACLGLLRMDFNVDAAVNLLRYPIESYL